MARIRTIKPEFWTDSKVVGLSPLARLLFIGAWNFADDYGALPADAKQLKLKVLPDEPCNADDLIDELLKAQALVEVTNGSVTFWKVRSWERHQKVDRRSSSQFGDPDSWSPAEDSPSPADSPRIPPTEGKGPGKGRDQGREEPSADADEVDDEFEQFWPAFPRGKAGKPGGDGARKPALAKWRRLTDEQRKACLVAVHHYRDHVEAPDGPIAAHAVTWLNQERWEQWQEPAVPRAGPAGTGQAPAPSGDVDYLDGWHGKVAR